MESLKGEAVKVWDLQKALIRVIDIVNYEGPLLMIFLNFKNYDVYLFD